MQTVFTNSAKIEAHPFTAPAPVLNIPASLLKVTPAGLVIVDQRPPACHVALHRAQFNAPDGKGYPFTLNPARSIGTASSSALMRMIRKAPGLEDIGPLYPKAIALPAVGLRHRQVAAISPNGSVLITGGHADYSIKVVSIESAKVLESAQVHCAPVTCLALSPDGSTLVTGSRDATAMVWRVLGASSSQQGVSSSSGSDPSLVATAAAQGSVAALSQPSVPSSSDGPTSRGGGSVYEGGAAAPSEPGRGKKRLEGPLHVLRGHVDEIVCCAVYADLDLVVTCSKIRGCLMHTIMRGRFIRTLPVERGDAVAISPDGTVVSTAAYFFVLARRFGLNKERLVTNLRHCILAAW
jgi:hypothetical protein